MAAGELRMSCLRMDVMYARLRRGIVQPRLRWMRLSVATRTDASHSGHLRRRCRDPRHPGRVPQEGQGALCDGAQLVTSGAHDALRRCPSRRPSRARPGGVAVRLTGLRPGRVGVEGPR